MQRHPSGCDPQAFRGRHRAPVPPQHLPPSRTIDPALLTLPGMQTALGELERSSPSLYRGTIDRANLTRMANDITEILVRHVNRLRLQANIAAHAAHPHHTPTPPHRHSTRKRARPLPCVEEIDLPLSPHHTSSAPRPSSYRQHPHAADVPRTLSLPRQRRRRTVRYVFSDDSDSERVRPSRHSERPHRSKEIRHNLNDDLAFEHMEQAARLHQHSPPTKPEHAHPDTDPFLSPQQTSDDEVPYVPKLVCPKLYVRERALQSDFASLTPIITDPDDDTDTEHFRKWNARRIKKPVHEDPNENLFMQRQCAIFPFGRKTRLRRDVIVDVQLMNSLAKQGLHHKNVSNILYTLPLIPDDFLHVGGRHWTDFDTTQAFRKTSSALVSDFHVGRRHVMPITRNGTPAITNNTPAKHHVPARKVQPQQSHVPAAKPIAPALESALCQNGSNAPTVAGAVHQHMSSAPLSSNAAAHTDVQYSRRLNGTNPIPPKRAEPQARLSNDNVLRPAAVEPVHTTRPTDGRQEGIHSDFARRPVLAMKQIVGLQATQPIQQASNHPMPGPDGMHAQTPIRSDVLQSMILNAQQQKQQPQYNMQLAMTPNRGSSSQIHPQKRSYPREQQKQVQPISDPRQAPAQGQVSADQRYLPHGISGRIPSKEEIEAYQFLLRQGLVSEQQSSQHPPIQSFLDWQRQLGIQGLQHQDALPQRQLQQHHFRQQQLLQQQRYEQQQRQLQHQQLRQQQLRQQQQRQQQQQQLLQLQQLQQLQQQLQQQQLQQQQLQQQQLRQQQLRQQQIRQQQIRERQQVQQHQYQQQQLRQQQQVQHQKVREQKLQEQQLQQQQFQQHLKLRQQQESRKRMKPVVHGAGNHLIPQTRVNVEPSQSVEQYALPGHSESRANPINKRRDQSQSIRRGPRYGSSDNGTDRVIGNGTTFPKVPLNSSPIDKNRRQPTLGLPATQTGSVVSHVRSGPQVAQPTPHPSAENTMALLNGPKISESANVLIMPDSDADPNSPTGGHELSESKKDNQPTIQVKRNEKSIPNASLAHFVSNCEPAPEVQMGSTRPPELPSSAVKGVPRWQCERPNLAATPLNGHATIQSQLPESRGSNVDPIQAVQEQKIGGDDQRRKYEEDYRAAYALQVRKAMEEIRKKNGNADQELG